ncbi:hypothetical protein NLJ89_g3442 [Agrocybe chaxingu]|uniref:Uncharacterized protein n=1 Tax=Agrocybe chaxingu TaxID=84603 RepID=A0A9W8K4X7_9AGAR|nr:hypothetical protein NLJ89_g3442 [Agrocybe chaxingu]
MVDPTDYPEAENPLPQAAASKRSQVPNAAQTAATSIVKYAEGTSASAGSLSSRPKARRKLLRVNSTSSAESSEPPRTPPDSINFDPTITTGTVSSEQGSTRRGQTGRYVRQVGPSPPVPRVPAEDTRKAGIEHLLQNVFTGSRKPSMQGLLRTVTPDDSDNRSAEPRNQRSEAASPATLKPHVIGSRLTPIPDTPAGHPGASVNPSYESIQEEAMQRIAGQHSGPEPTDCGTDQLGPFGKAGILPPAPAVPVGHTEMPLLSGKVGDPGRKYAEKPGDQEFNFRVLEEAGSSVPVIQATSKVHHSVLVKYVAAFIFT